jgi:hypothetical protein
MSGEYEIDRRAARRNYIVLVTTMTIIAIAVTIAAIVLT